MNTNFENDDNFLLIKNKIAEKNKIQLDIRRLENELKNLKNKKKSIQSFISNNCKHIWIKKDDTCMYSKSYNMCIKCNTIKGMC